MEEELIKTTQAEEALQNAGLETPAPPKKKKKKKKKLPPKVIVVENLGVRFRIQEQKVDNLKEYFVRLIKRRLNFN